MKQVLTMAVLVAACTATVTQAEFGLTKLGLPSPNQNCIHYQVVNTGETRVESNRVHDYSTADVGGYTFSPVKGVVPYIVGNKVKGFSFKGEATQEILKAWHKLCD